MFWSNCSYALSYGKHKKINNYWCFIEKIWQDIFFYKGFLHRHWRFTGQQGKGGAIFYSTLPLPLAHKHWDIYLQLCMWDDYHIFLITMLVFTRLLLNEIYHLIELPFEWLIDDAMFVCLLDELILGFCYSDLTLETGGFELASTITLVLQANQLTKCASHPQIIFLMQKVIFDNPNIKNEIFPG